MIQQFTMTIIVSLHIALPQVFLTSTFIFNNKVTHLDKYSIQISTSKELYLKPCRFLLSSNSSKRQTPKFNPFVCWSSARKERIVPSAFPATETSSSLILSSVRVIYCWLQSWMFKQINSKPEDSSARFWQSFYPYHTAMPVNEHKQKVLSRVVPTTWNSNPHLRHRKLAQ